MTLTWWEALDLDWETELLILDPPRELRMANCGNCGAMLYTNGTCPNCDRPPQRFGSHR